MCYGQHSSPGISRFAKPFVPKSSALSSGSTSSSSGQSSVGTASPIDPQWLLDNNMALLPPFQARSALSNPLMSDTLNLASLLEPEFMAPARNSSDSSLSSVEDWLTSKSVDDDESPCSDSSVSSLSAVHSGPLTFPATTPPALVSGTQSSEESQSLATSPVMNSAQSLFPGTTSFFLQPGTQFLMPAFANSPVAMPSLPAAVPARIDTETVTKQTMKRRKNTESARQSRRRKAEYVQSLEDQLRSVQGSNKALERDNSILKAENASYLKRIEGLERQVEEYHSVLVAIGRRGDETCK